MTNQAIRKTVARGSRTAGLCLGAVLLLAGQAGCPKKQEAAAPAPPPPPPPAAPQRATLENVMMDPRVQFPEERLPESQSLVEAVASLASAIATGDDLMMSGLLDGSSEVVLAKLIESGEWESSTAGIEAVRVVALQADGAGARVGLAVQDPGGAYLLGWSGTDNGGQWVFSGLAVRDQRAARASELDGVELEEIGVAAPRAEAPPPPPPPKPEERPGGSRPGSSPNQPFDPNRPMPSPTLPGGMSGGGA